MSTHELHEIRAIVDQALAATSDQLLVSQRQYVDVLLDLRSIAVSPVMRSTIEDRLREIRFVTMIHASKIRADLNTVVAVAVSEIDDELEMAWAEAALTCDCHEFASALLIHDAPTAAAMESSNVPEHKVTT